MEAACISMHMHCLRCPLIKMLTAFSPPISCTKHVKPPVIDMTIISLRGWGVGLGPVLYISQPHGP